MIPKKVPFRYGDQFIEVSVDSPPVVMTAVGPRAALASRWKCRMCGKCIKPNNAGAQSHIALHLRLALQEKPQ